MDDRHGDQNALPRLKKTIVPAVIGIVIIVGVMPSRVLWWKVW